MEGKTGRTKRDGLSLSKLSQWIYSVHYSLEFFLSLKILKSDIWIFQPVTPVKTRASLKFQCSTYIQTFLCKPTLDNALSVSSPVIETHLSCSTSEVTISVVEKPALS